MNRRTHTWLVPLACLVAASGCGDNAGSTQGDANPNVDATDVIDTPPPQDLPGDTTIDASIDTAPTMDAPADVAPDAPADVAPDAPADVAPDAPADVAPDAPADVAPDLPTDIAPDALVDVAPDAPADVAPDLPTDVAPDAPADVTPDLPDDIAPDLPVDITLDTPVDIAPDAPTDAGPPLPSSCAALLRRDPSTPSGTYTIAPSPGVTLSVYCDMSTGRGYTFATGSSANASATEILAACPTGLSAFAVRSEAHADALRRYVHTLSSSGAWYWANHFAGPAAPCPTLANHSGWLRSATDWVDAAIRPSFLAPLNFSENCLAAGVFDPVPVNDTDGYANRGCAGCTVLYNSTEQSLPGTVVCSVNDLPSCAPGTEECNGDAADGCETHVSIDDANCGACGRACVAGLSCAASVCVHTVGGSPVPPPPSIPTGAPTVMATGIAGPQGLVVARDGRVYVSAISAGNVVRIDPTTMLTTTFATGFSGPAQLTFDAAGNLVVAERSGNVVTRVAINADGTAGARSTIATGFSGPWGVLYQSDGNLLVSNEFGSTVDRVSIAGVVTRGVISGYNAPLDMRFDTMGRLWVGQYYGTSTSDGTLVHQYDAALSHVRMASGFSGPIGIAVDDAGNAYVANWDGGAASAGRIVRVAPDNTTSVFYRGLSGPHAIAFDATGGLWVAEYVNNRVLRLGGR